VRATGVDPGTLARLPQVPCPARLCGIYFGRARQPATVSRVCLVQAAGASWSRAAESRPVGKRPVETPRGLDRAYSGVRQNPGGPIDVVVESVWLVVESPHGFRV